VPGARSQLDLSQLDLNRLQSRANLQKAKSKDMRTCVSLRLGELLGHPGWARRARAKWHPAADAAKERGGVEEVCCVCLCVYIMRALAAGARCCYLCTAAGRFTRCRAGESWHCTFRPPRLAVTLDGVIRKAVLGCTMWAWIESPVHL
jgi:hypothetical protein